MKPWEKTNRFAPDDQSQKRWISFWGFGLIYAYSKMDLTVASGKLVALPGTDKLFMAYMNDIYMAYLWRSRLEDSLLWYVGPKSLQLRPLVHRAPNWSWAPIDGPIHHCLSPYDQSRIQLVDVELSHATDDATGAVTDGWLDLRGVLKPLRLCESKESDTTRRIALNDAINSPQHDTIEESACLMTGIVLDFFRTFVASKMMTTGKGAYSICHVSSGMNHST